MVIMSARLLAVGIVVVTLYACGENRQPTAPTPPVATVPPPNPTPPVVGTVFDFQTQKPISGAVVSLATGVGVGDVPVGVMEGAVTDANGRYSMPQPQYAGRSFLFYVNNAFVGLGYARAMNYRADLAVHNGPCVTRYGMVMDARTFRPIGGVRIIDLSNRVRATTDGDGWYQVDWGCPTAGYVGFNTTWLTAMHPSYRSKQHASGRGTSKVYREDVLLDPL